jgi:hypothetical protein
MGTDRIKLFDKKLSDQILAMELESLLPFLEGNIGVLKQKGATYSLVLFEMEESSCSVSQAVENLLFGECTLTGLRSDLAQDFAFGVEDVLLDYWGCYVEVFGDHPEGSISSLEYLPAEEEEYFLLLRPEHVDRMIKSLREHLDDLRIMNKEMIWTVEQWRDFCTDNPGFMVAYMFDF